MMGHHKKWIVNLFLVAYVLQIESLAMQANQQRGDTYYTGRQTNIKDVEVCHPINLT